MDSVSYYYKGLFLVKELQKMQRKLAMQIFCWPCQGGHVSKRLITLAVTTIVRLAMWHLACFALTCTQLLCLRPVEQLQKSNK